jgi:hypothetical protein
MWKKRNMIEIAVSVIDVAVTAKLLVSVVKAIETAKRRTPV